MGRNSEGTFRHHAYGCVVMCRVVLNPSKKKKGKRDGKCLIL